MLALVEVPEHGDTVLTTGSSEGTVGRDGEGVKVTGVTVVGGLQLAVGELPDLTRTVSSSYSQSICKFLREYRGDQRSWWKSWSHRVCFTPLK